RKLRLGVREVRLKDIQPAASPQETRKQIIALANGIKEKNKQIQDGYIRELMRKRSDLAGLPFLLGKDCELDKDGALRLGQMSVFVRESLRNSILESREKRDP